MSAAESPQSSLIKPEDRAFTQDKDSLIFLYYSDFWINTEALLRGRESGLKLPFLV